MYKLENGIVYEHKDYGSYTAWVIHGPEYIPKQDKSGWLRFDMDELDYVDAPEKTDPIPDNSCGPDQMEIMKAKMEQLEKDNAALLDAVAYLYEDTNPTT